MAHPLSAPAHTSLHPIYSKKLSLEENHQLSSNLWRIARKAGMVAIACMGCGSAYLLVRLKNWGFQSLNKFYTGYSLVCLGFAFLCIEALFSEYANKKVAHHQKKHQFQLNFKEIQNLDDEQFRARLMDEIGLSAEAVDELLTHVLEKEKIAPLLIKYCKYNELLTAQEETLKTTTQRQQKLISDLEEGIKKDTPTFEIEKAYSGFLTEIDDLTSTFFKSQALIITIKIKRAYIRAILQSPGYAGDYNKDLLILGFIPGKEMTPSMFEYDFAKKMLLLSAVNRDYDPIALKHDKSDQTISVKALLKLAENEEQLERCLFSNPDQFIFFGYDDENAPAHLTGDNFRSPIELASESEGSEEEPFEADKK